MPPLLGEGGTRLVGVKSSPYGDTVVEKDQEITNQYYYQPLRNGAMVIHIFNIRYKKQFGWYLFFLQ